MRILFYNWVDYLDDERRGGGVSIYQRNLITALNAEQDVSCLFLSSGISYDLLSDRPRWEQVRHGPSEQRALRYEIVNSGVLAPAHHSFGDERQIDEPATKEVFFDFLRRNGPFDVVHFNNLEGIPASVLKLKETFPGTRVVLALHNYYPACPQVNLWHRESENCRDYDGGRKCVGCLPFRHDERVIRLANAVAFTLKKNGVRPGSRTFDRGFGPAMRVAARLVRLYRRRFDRKPAPAAPQPQHRPGQLLQTVEARHHRFARRRAAMAELINTHCDTVLCVSDRVGTVAKRYGIAPVLLETGYIGTRHAEKFVETRPRGTVLREDGTVTLAYLGYMRRDKGFYFLLDALEALPVERSRCVHLVICAQIVDGAAMERIGALSDNFASVRFADGYGHDDLDALLADVDLGVIPVLWEDNLPQVAIEMHARHIPLLTSDLGGAQELGRCPDLVFAADDTDSFADRIAAVLEGEIDLHAYWESAMTPYSMADHLGQLMQVYDTPPRAPALLPSMPGADPEIRPAQPGEEAGDEADTAGYGSTRSA